jgi:hypothetical protein
MAYLKPPAMVTKIFNNLAMCSTLWDVHTLEVARRNAVDPQRVPVIPLQFEGSLYVVSTRGGIRLGHERPRRGDCATRPEGKLHGVRLTLSPPVT